MMMAIIALGACGQSRFVEVRPHEQACNTPQIPGLTWVHHSKFEVDSEQEYVAAR